MSEPLRAKASLPTGAVAILFTDIEGSTALWEQTPRGCRRRWPRTTRSRDARSNPVTARW